MDFSKRVGTALTALALILPAAAQAVDFGSEGEPVDLVIGYQPYYTESWSGVVNNGKQFWKEYLPEGSTAKFEIGLQGSVIVNAMTGEKQHIGYMGDMPAISSTFKNIERRGGTDMRIVATLGTSMQQCNIFLVSNDAPDFESGVEAVKWMDGKTVAAPHGACTDRFARRAFEEAGIEPRRYLNQSIEVISTNFRARKLDAAAIWEPTATKIEQDGIAKRVATGEDFNILDGAFMVMLNDLIEQRPDVVEGWLNAELDSQLYMLDMENADEIAEMAAAQTEQMKKEVMYDSLYGNKGTSSGVKLQLDFIVSPRVEELMANATEYLHNLPMQPAAEPQMRDDAVDDSFARRILEERGLESPLGQITAEN